MGYNVEYMTHWDTDVVFDIAASCLGLDGEECGRALRPVLDGSEIVLVASSESGWVCGFASYRLARGNLELVRLAVHEDWRRKRVASALLALLRGKLSRGAFVGADVPERNLPAQMVLRSAGFEAVAYVRPEDPDGDGVVRMVCRAFPRKNSAAG